MGVDEHNVSAYPFFLADIPLAEAILLLSLCEVEKLCNCPLPRGVMRLSGRKKGYITLLFKMENTFQKAA